MKSVLQKYADKCFLVMLCIAILSVNRVQAQTCPPPVTSAITSYSNTYYPGEQAIVSAGSTSVTIGGAAYGTTPISAGDVLLIIQMQGAQINSNNNNTYGDGVSGSGYLNNAELFAGNMEYVIATNSVPLTGGTLTLLIGTVNNYKKAAFGADGQYTYQVIRVPVYYSLILDADITPPNWDGATGGVIVMSVMNTFDMNGHAINVTGAGFRGGGGVQITGGTGGIRDFAMVSPTDANLTAQVGIHASKGEGIAGTPRLINSNYSAVQKNTEEGYPGGSFGMGAPGNAGGGGSDDNTPINANNSGGGGGGNGGVGGKGGNSYGTGGPYGGYSGAPFAQRSALRLVMGGGGGAGGTNNGTGSPGSGLASGGAAGGGIVIISAGAIINAGFIYANGNSANGTVVNDAAGGGGAGGSVLINAHTGHSNLTVYANGGNGGTNFWNHGVTSPHGPGGGGGGGVIYTDGILNAASSVTGGTAGTTYNGTGTFNYGALDGTAGIAVTGPVMAFPPGCVVLPMQFLLVNGKRNGGEVLINWEITNEKEVTNYVIERSTNGINFVTAGIVNKKPDNGETGRYKFSDASAGTEATIFYRIKAQGAAGQKYFSKVITIQTVLAEGALDIGPVPATGYSTIRWSSTGNNNKLNIILFNISGKAVLNRQYQLKKGLNELRLTDLQSLPNGIYIVKASDGASYRNGKLVIHN